MHLHHLLLDISTALSRTVLLLELGLLLLLNITLFILRLVECLLHLGLLISRDSHSIGPLSLVCGRQLHFLTILKGLEILVARLTWFIGEARWLAFVE